MDFIPSITPLSITLPVIGMIAGLFAGVLIGAVGMPKGKKSQAAYWAAVSIVAVVFLVSLVGFGSAVAKSWSWSLAFDEAVDEAYGVSLTVDEVRELGYPRAMPTDDFEVFGSVEHDGSQLFLVWTGAQFELGTFDSADFQPLSER